MSPGEDGFQLVERMAFSMCGALVARGELAKVAPLLEQFVRVRRAVARMPAPFDVTYAIGALAGFGWPVGHRPPDAA